jgi:hypothetical protein
MWLLLQVGYEKEWLHFLKQYVVPVNGRLFPGYYSEVSNWLLCNYFKGNKIPKIYGGHVVYVTN